MSFWIYALIIAFLLFWRFSLSSKNRYPPGPPSVPGVGHVFQVPTTQTWRYFENLSLRYGPLFRLSLAGNDVLVLNKSIDAEELLGRRSHNYSSRPPLVYAGKYQSNNKRLVLLPYGPTLKRQRTAFHQMLQPRVVGAYESMQEFESLRLLHDIVNKPTEAFRHTQRFAAALVFTLSYGKRLGDNDSDLDSVIAVIQGFVRDTYPGAHLVDTFPALDLLPDFLAPWRAKARAKHEFEMKLYNRLVLEVKDRMESGKQDLECFAARLWEHQNIEALDLEEISYVAGTAFEAGTDSTAGTIQWFFMAMILYPDAMRQAQVELDGLLGADGQTVPGFAHINELPYCFALTKEVLRWAPAAPGGFPHYSDADDEYKGFKINAKTMVIPCIWSMHHDPDEFPDPYVFRPERFLPSGGAVENDSLTEGHYGFGFGRRKCPGQYLGSKTIWIGLTRLLWAFDIQPGLDKDGKPVIISPDNCTSGMTSKPVDFEMRLMPRSDGHAATIRREWALLNPVTGQL